MRFKPSKISRIDKPLTQEEMFDFWVSDIFNVVDEHDKSIFINKYLHQKDIPEFVLSEENSFKFNNKTNKFTFSSSIVYTPDRLIIFTKQAHGVFFKTEQDILEGKNKEAYFLAYETSIGYVAFVEVKAPAGYGAKNTSDASFRVKASWVYQIYKMHINKTYLIPLKKLKKPKLGLYLFLDTFLPFRFFLTDKTFEKRKWNYEFRAIKEYIKDTYGN